MAAPIVMPFVMGMLLGRSIDLTTYNVGGEVFDDRVYNETKVNQFISTYTVLQDNQFPYTFAGLPVDLVMKNKAGYISSSSGAMGLDGLLKETSWKQRSAVIAVQSAVQTVRRTLREDAEPLANWTSRVPDSQTHYAHSVVYGGWAFVLYRFACEIPGDAKIVRKTLTDTLGAFGELGPETAELWQKAQEAIKSNPEIRGKVTVIIKTYATFPFKQDFRTPQRLLDAVSEVPKLVGPVGKPMIMELLPLHDLDAKYPVVEEHHDSDTKLENLVEMFDDVKNTKKSIHRWISRLDADLTEDQEYKIAELLLHLNIFIKLFHEIASEASIYKDVNQNNLINAAATVYEQRIELFTYSYDRIFRRLKEDIDPECGNSFYPKVRGLLKVHKRDQLEPIKMMEGDVKHCKIACLEEPRCRAIAFVEKLVTKKLSDTNPRVWQVKTERNLCLVYFRSSSTADVVEIPENSVADVYDRTCQWVASP